MLWEHVWSSVSKEPSISRIRVLICHVDDTAAAHMADLAASDRPETDVIALPPQTALDKLATPPTAILGRRR